MVSSGMHVKFPGKRSPRAVFSLGFVVEKGKDGPGQAVQKDVCEDLSWAAFRR